MSSSFAVKTSLVFAGLLLPVLCPAAAPSPRNAPKIIIVNDDGHGGFFTGKYKTAEDLRKQVLTLRDTQVAVLEWNVTSGSRVNYPSKVTELIGEGVTEFGRRGDRQATEAVHHFAAEGVDTLKVVADACHEAGVKCQVAMRMNGDYAVTPEGDNLPRLLNSSFWWKHPELRVRGLKGEDKTHLSYAFPEVRAFKMAILREVAERDIDGVHLDYLRHPAFFGYEEPLLQAFQAKHHEDPRQLPANDARWLQLRCDIMTGFVRDVRKMLDDAGQKKGRHLALSARVDWKDYRAWGCDIETWMKEGLIDYIVLAQHTLGGYEFDLAPFVKMARGTGCAVLFGEEAALSGHDLTAEEDKLVAAGKMKMPSRGMFTVEQYQARAARWYAAGADGVHLFNEGRHSVMSTLGTVPPADSHTK